MPVAPERTQSQNERGQATVEFVALLPLIILALVIGWQIVLIGHAAWSAHGAARAAARAQAIGKDTEEAAKRALPEELDNRVKVIETDAGVTVKIRALTVVPGMPTLKLTAKSTFADQSS